MFSFSRIPIVAAIIYISPVCLSVPLPPNESHPSNQNPMDRAAQAAVHIGEFLRNYTIQLPNITDLSASVSSPGKKAASTIYIQDSNGNVNVELHDLRDIVPFIVDNFFSPIIKRVFLNGNAYTLFHGEPPSTEAPAPAQPSVSATPPKEYIDLIIQVEERTEPPTTTRATTTVAPATSTTEQDGNSGRDLLEEGNANGGSGTVATSSSTSAPHGTKYKIRVKERTTQSPVSTRKPYVADEDDEDESGVFNKIKHL